MNKMTLAMLSLLMFAGCNEEKKGATAEAGRKDVVARPILAADNPGSSHDWPMWGRTPNRQMVTDEKGVPTEWDVEAKTNIKWVANLGSKRYGNPVISGCVVIVGTYMEGLRDPKFVGDAICLMIFDE